MGRADDRRARQRGGRRAAPGHRSPQQAAPETAPETPAASGGTATAVESPVAEGATRAERRKAAAKGKPGTPGKQGKNGKPAKGRIRRLFTWKKMLGAFLGVCLLGIGAFIALYMSVSVPEGNPLAQTQSNVYKYSDGSVLARKGTVNRENVDLSKVPKDVQHTFVAAENKSFYTDNGIDLRGMARGLYNTAMGRGTQGGSTITQQYVKNYYLSQDQTVTRKLKELVISLKLDRERTKDDILAGYINTSYYGRGAYGIQAAAQAYYRVDAQKLSVQQGAYLASLLQAPSQYDWAVAGPVGKKLVQNRWNYTLNNMVGQGWLDKTKRDAMKFPIPKEPKAVSGLEGQKGYLVELANTQLENHLMKSQGISRSDAESLVIDKGWTITLNIDPKKQAKLEAAIKSQLTSKLDGKKRKVDNNVQAGAVSVDPKTGKILAMYGGVDYYKHYTSNATRADYQPASTFKPIILAAAVDQNAQTQDGKAIDANTIYDGTSGRPVKGSDIAFAPPNEDDADYGKIPVQTAMNKSVNSVFAQMGVDVGMKNVLKTANDLGLDTTDVQAVPAMTLGTMGASPLEMAGVYATLDNHGRKVTPTIIASAEQAGRKVDLPNPIGDQVINKTAADQVTSVLTGVVDDGTAKVSVAQNPLRKGQEVAGKTGTSDNNKSAWFTGYTPDLVTSVGLFGEDAKTHNQVSLTGATGLIPGTGRINGGGYPAQIWAAYTFGVTKKQKFELDTELGAAVKPSATPTLSSSPSETPSQTPSQTPTKSASPSLTPSKSPSLSPTTSPPATTTPPSAPATTPTGDITDNPLDQGGGQ
ncbi:membrane peptidoglycan carboxypeptidase [Streptomyces sp. Ag109_O5-1]|uniref:transglycosylase domain-containing protein n=1 Tax=Streptomyces sp. Ag109_O5-1 TaxID=1938851 RepID=UPI000F504B19|nr:transglycosylase domain-containing protein [Streptomyces sp. Ag109_O5-1]RPE41074.1 membrane peptidoglycan carboxypeptidase [Streptomyces sp. Ag109_O5-1]